MKIQVSNLTMINISIKFLRESPIQILKKNHIATLSTTQAELSTTLDFE